MQKYDPLNDSPVQEWLNSQKLSTRGPYQSYWKRFHEFTGLTGGEVLESRKADKNFSWERKVIEFKNWMAEKGYAPYTATAAAMAVRSWFEFHRCHLEFRSQESSKIAKRTRLTEDYRFSLDDLAKMWAVADLNEKYVLAAGKSFGLRAGDFLRLTRGDLEPYVDKGEPPISIGAYRTQKEGTTAYPFIDTDALEIIKLKLVQMARDSLTKATDKMLPYGYEVQLSRVIRRIVERAGLNVGSKQVRFHCMRKFLIDHLSSFMSESKWKLIVGKSISESAYVSPDSLREDYKRAMAETTFKRAAEMEDRIKKIEEITKNLPPDVKAEMDKFGIYLRQSSKLRKPKSTDCPDGEHCQQIVAEADLARFLGEGWRVAAPLPSGKIVIER
ncbi:hypothetical protein MUP01_09160 [Candidatus Bathyarchaeota archaeon]|nr:hypothetical protein [Candidatus Bathyarchaeota archaeon]